MCGPDDRFRGPVPPRKPSGTAPIGMESTMTAISAFLSSSLPLLCVSVLMGCAAIQAWRAQPAPRAVPVRVRDRR
ncbi:hypothetical protein AA13595_0568 [Gluconacetobacter johannae DSM 13595]|nr:hypothetical protein AA13595_0568 [Gluconacetobacter johannae DSM 13595]